MAKKPKKADAGDGAGGEAEAPKSKKKLIIIAAAAVLLLAGGGGAFVMKKRAAAEAEHVEQAAEVKKPAVFLEVREMMLNLSPDAGAERAKFAKLRIALELKDAKVEGEVRPLMPRVEDALQVYMRDLRSTDLSGSLGLYRLREELLKRVNIAVYPAHVEAVLFKDVIVQ